MFTSEKQAEIYDTQNSGAGTTNTYTFDGVQEHFYGPSSIRAPGNDVRLIFKMYVTPTTTAATATATLSDGAVTKITVTGIGANYTATPIVVLSGGERWHHTNRHS